MDEQKRLITKAAAARIRTLRRAKNISQEQLALRANLNPAYLGQIERALKCPTLDTLYKIATALDVPLWDLLRLDNHFDPCASQERLAALLQRVPANRQTEFFQIMEDIAALLEKQNN